MTVRVYDLRFQQRIPEYRSWSDLSPRGRHIFVWLGKPIYIDSPVSHVSPWGGGGWILTMVANVIAFHRRPRIPVHCRYEEMACAECSLAQDVFCKGDTNYARAPTSSYHCYYALSIRHWLAHYTPRVAIYSIPSGRRYIHSESWQRFRPPPDATPLNGDTVSYLFDTLGSTKKSAYHGIVTEFDENLHCYKCVPKQLRVLSGIAESWLVPFPRAIGVCLV